ncbi:MATE family efflux transporter [Nocardia salmonicida]|uniref:MATE family efflux transporter n=1 Tax=Nocardia salmonicida TaxID=53431 RepID=UPI00378C8995
MTEIQSAAQLPESRFVVRLRQVAGIAGPVVLTSATTVVLGLTDTALLGHDSTQALGTAALVLPVWIFCTALVVPWGSATQVFVARWHGAGHTDSIERLARAGLFAALGIGAVFALAASIAAPAIVAFTAPADLDRVEATVMLWVLLCGLPFSAATAHVRGVLAGTGDTVSGAWNAVAVAALNSALSAVLIFGAGLGPVGAAIGSSIAVIAGTGGLCLQATAKLGFEKGSAPAAHGLLRAWSALAVPDVVFGMASYGSDAVIASLVATTGTVALAAHRLMSLAIAIVWMFVFGTAVAISVLVGQCLGAGDEHGRRAVVRAGTVLMLAASGGTALLIAVAAPGFFRLFTDDPAVTAAASTVAWTLLVLAPIMAMGTVYAAQLRAAGDTKGVMYVSLFSVGVTLPAVWMFTVVWQWGLSGVYSAIVVGWIARTAATYFRYGDQANRCGSGPGS